MKCERTSGFLWQCALAMVVCAVLCSCKTTEPTVVIDDSGFKAAAREKYECEAVLLDLKKSRGTVPSKALILYESARGKVNLWLNSVQAKVEQLNANESLSVSEKEFYDANGKEIKAFRAYLGSKGEVRWEQVLLAMNTLIDEIDRRRQLQREANIAKTKEILLGLKWDSPQDVMRRYP